MHFKLTYLCLQLLQMDYISAKYRKTKKKITISQCRTETNFKHKKAWINSLSTVDWLIATINYHNWNLSERNSVSNKLMEEAILHLSVLVLLTVSSHSLLHSPRSHRDQPAAPRGCWSLTFFVGTFSSQDVLEGGAAAVLEPCCD